MNETEKLLFTTGALRVSPADRLFFYTSGKLGPFYVNTHFLFGSEEAANALLAGIDTRAHNREELAGFVFDSVSSQYAQNSIFRTVIDALVSKVRAGSARPAFISGGERRDWFFSVMCAQLLGLPHITLYKDMTASVGHGGDFSLLTKLPKGAEVLHISDLVTEASSYERAWIPAIKALGGNMTATATVVDRAQGGFDLLRRAGVSPTALVTIGKEFAADAAADGAVTKQQAELMGAYIGDPEAAVEKFLALHPGYITAALAAGGRDAVRAALCMEKGFYGQGKGQ